MEWDNQTVSRARNIHSDFGIGGIESYTACWKLVTSEENVKIEKICRIENWKLFCGKSFTSARFSLGKELS